MAQLTKIDGEVAPLFDRLRIAKSPAEPQPLGALGRPALQASIQRELTYLFNVRSWPLPNQFAEAQYTVVGFGVPDFTAFSPQSGEDRDRLGKLLTRAITAFEPRLRQVQAVVEIVEDDPQALMVRLTAGLVTHSLVTPITLTVSLPSRGSANQIVDVEVQAYTEP